MFSGLADQCLVACWNVCPRKSTTFAAVLLMFNCVPHVRRHMEWLRPAAWIAIDDESSLWTADERRGHLVATNGCLGLMAPAAQDRLTTVLLGNSGLGKAEGP